MVRLSSVALPLLGLAILLAVGEACNKAVCASIVLKCHLLKSCDCNVKAESCTCCKQCFDCLSHLYSECCSCVEMCPAKTKSMPSRLSHIEDLPDPIPQLFSALTQEEDRQGRWTSITYPVDVPPSSLKKEPTDPQSTLDKDFVTENCTVVYMAQCMSLNKCKESCSSVGAASYRWFHDACCECIGQFCPNYGINEARCSACNRLLEDEEALDDLDFEEIEAELELLQQEYGDEAGLEDY